MELCEPKQLTNFVQPAWTLKTPRGATQSNLYSNLPRTQAEQNAKAYGRSKAVTYQDRTQYPTGFNTDQTGFSNIRPTTVTKAQNEMTGQNLYNATNSLDPRTDNPKSKPYALENMRVQLTNFNNPYGALIAVGVFLIGALYIRGR